MKRPLHIMRIICIMRIGINYKEVYHTLAVVLTIANQKGGVGKTTSAAAVAAWLGRVQKGRVLVIDLDPQCNLSATFPYSDHGDIGAYDLISRGANIKSVIHDAAGVDIIPASEQLANVNLEVTQTGKEYRLRECLSEIRDAYDYIIIDTAPSLGLLTVNAFVASDYLIVPTSADVYSLISLGQLYSTYEVVRKYCNSQLKIAGILLTRHNPRTILSKDMAMMIDDAAKQFGTVVFKNFIREGVAVREAQARHVDIFSYAAKSNPAEDYRKVIAELLQIILIKGE